MATFFDGAVMAYRDCEAFTRDMAHNLPPEVDFLKKHFEYLAAGFGEKANTVLAEINKAGGIR